MLPKDTLTDLDRLFHKANDSFYSIEEQKEELEERLAFLRWVIKEATTKKASKKDIAKLKKLHTLLKESYKHFIDGLDAAEAFSTGLEDLLYAEE